MIYKDWFKSVAIGDYCGSAFEGHHGLISENDLTDEKLLYQQGHYNSHLTDDSVCTLAIASALINGTFNYKEMLKLYGCHYKVGYAGMFRDWLAGKVDDGYGSWGNGSAMRCSSIAWYSKTLEECLQLTEDSCQCTHNSEIGILGAKALNHSIWLAKNGKSKDEIYNEVMPLYFKEWYDNNITFDNYIEYFTNKGENVDSFNWYIKCDNIVAMCICAFLVSENYEESIKYAISQGFDTDTAGAIIGPLAYAYYKEIPKKYIDVMNLVFTPEMKVIEELFAIKYINC